MDNSLCCDQPQVWLSAAKADIGGADRTQSAGKGLSPRHGVVGRQRNAASDRMKNYMPSFPQAAFPTVISQSAPSRHSRRRPSLQLFRGLTQHVIPAVCWAGIQVFYCRTSLKSGSPLLKTPFCMYPGKASWIPEYYRGDDELNRHCREFLTSSFTQPIPPHHFRRRHSLQSSRSLLLHVIPAVFWAGIQFFCCRIYPKSGSPLLKNPFCMYPGKASWIPEYYLGDDGR